MFDNTKELLESDNFINNQEEKAIFMQLFLDSEIILCSEIVYNSIGRNSND